MNDRNYERTIYEAKLDAQYGIRYNELNARLYRRIDLFFGAISLIGGSGAVIAAISNVQVISVTLGIILAATAVLERLIRPVEKAIQHDEYRLKFAEIASADEEDLKFYDRELLKLQSTAPHGFSSLGVIAYNANLNTLGRTEYLTETTKWERLIGWLA